ncbi:flagellar protein FlaG [Malonomonas rubra DSM 5091]|uniref:Flagellar protein FlaG n=1 Tax=Malonomonas rubra DSM 5091 TaxID=1122189 RepID=A0A1M6LBA4_MALRU|nr:flagellar protein FlaG [Malonomonas rubra]SHJ68466.1 flagellar protein FlaG [Malonomonas rubra DSM 5091]
MNVEALNVQSPAQFQLSKASDEVSESRKKAENAPQSELLEKKQAQPEELLKQIKSLTEGGIYSVRFENDERTHGMVVKIVDRESDEILRQVPAEEILELKAALDDLRGNIVDTQG